MGPADWKLMSTRISGGKDRGRRLQTPKGGIRPTTERVRAAIFSILGDRVQGARVLDLYAGTGAMGLEALSRGAAWADFVEEDARSCSTIETNIRSLGYQDRARVVRVKVRNATGTVAILDGSSTDGQTSTGGPGGREYDLVFIDPPYGDDPWDGLLGDLAGGPLLSGDATVVAEYRSGRVLADRYGRLQRVSTRRYGDSSISLFTPAVANG